MTSILLIANPSAGGGRVPKLLPSVRRKLDSLGIEHRTGLTSSLADAVTLTEQALDRGEIPVAFSGDGVAGVVARTASYHEGAVFGVLPGGTGNDFCGHVGIPSDAVEACEVIANGVATEIDLGEANGERFLGIASFGYDSLANEAANSAPRFLGRGVYVWGAISALIRWRPARFTVVADGIEKNFEGWSVLCANTSRYGGGMLIAPNASIDDGKFDLICTLKSSRLRFIRMFPKVFKGTHIGDANLDVSLASAVVVSADRPFTIYADGDPLTELPAELRIIPLAVKVLLPQ
ncbi:unannotated protein [freshwater metagenome]|uniref:Unannotated protein n=1 Tax=freshwater metagenome TaxID=449393 RepID=A0A6J5ZFL8_9ZZZZ|nr:YegS/Rv2252/BmrU family lipid kinase [Actinomycetota bacterium]